MNEVVARFEDGGGVGAGSACGEPLYRMEGVGVRYGKEWALRGVNLEVWEGDVLAIVGPNGAGKSTLLKVMLGLVAATEGRVVCGEPGMRAGYVPQRLGVAPGFPITVGEFLALHHPGRFFWFGGVPRRGREAVWSGLERVGAGGLIGRRLGSLSGGELQRVLIAAALLRGPRVLLLDEPCAGIDRGGTEELEGLLRDLRARLGLTVVFVSHDLHFVSGLAVRVGCLNRGFCGIGSVREVLAGHVAGVGFQERLEEGVLGGGWDYRRE